MKFRHSRSGFTLLEVAVAMAIAGLGVVTLLEIFSLGLRLGTRTSETIEVVGEIEQLLDDAWTRGEVRDGTERGTTAGGRPWVLRVTPLQEDSALLSKPWELKEVTVRVESVDGRRPYLEVKTLRLVRVGSDTR